MEPQLVLKRIETRSEPNIDRNVNNPRAGEGSHFPGVAKWDVNNPFHLAMLGSKGILQTYILETTGGGSKAYLYPWASFQLHFDFEPSESGQGYSEPLRKIKIHSSMSDDAIATLRSGHGGHQQEIRRAVSKPIEQTWGTFEFIPQRPSEVVFFQDGSRRILFARLPGGSPGSVQVGEGSSTARIGGSSKSKVYCIGRHSSTVCSIAVRGDGLALVSAARDGYLRLWRICDGSMIAQIMFSRWRQPRSPHSPRHGKSTAKSKFITNHNDELDNIDQMSSAMQVLSFFGTSWDLCMACPHGELRIWSMKECESSSSLNIAEVGSLVVGKDAISALALHVADCNFPMQSTNNDHGETSSLLGREGVNTQFMAIGTTNQELQVWSRHTQLTEWTSAWGTTFSVDGASIVSLSFRSDGGLLAVAVSRFGQPKAFNECPSHDRSKPCKDQDQPRDRLYLYSTSSWGCVGWLSFTSHLGSCLFYHPQFNVDDKNDPRSSATQMKVSSCRLLLVSTSGGPQTHILPEYGLFGSSHDQCEQNQVTHLNCTKGEKTVSWADRKRDLGLQCHEGSQKETQELPTIHGEGDGTGFCDTSAPMPEELGISKKTALCSPTLEFDTNEMPCNSGKRWLMKELSYDQIGLQTLRNVVARKCKSCYQSHPHKFKTKIHPRNCFCKEGTSKSRGSKANLGRSSPSIISKHKCKKKLPLGYLKGICQDCKQHCSQKQPEGASSSNCNFSFSPPPQNREKTQKHTTPTKKDTAIGEESLYLGTKMDASTLSKQNVETETPHEWEETVNPKVKKVVTFFAPKTPEVIPNHIGGQSPNWEAAISHSRRRGQEGHLGTSTNMKSCCSKKEKPKQQHDPKQPPHHPTRREPRCDASSAHHRIGGEELHELLVMNVKDRSPFLDMVRMGGTFRQMSPMSTRSAVVRAAAVDPSKPSEEKPGPELNRPVAFSTTNLMQRLQDIEHETFDLDAALQVAKAKGIVLSKHDKLEIKAALEKEERREGSSKCEPELEGRKWSARYVPLLKIPDPQLSLNNGPYVAPRKVKRQTEVKGEDVMRTNQPALFDLWDLQDRCPQVSSANIDQANAFNVTTWRRTLGILSETNKNSVWVQREDVCRAAASAHSIYESCLYKPNIESQCHCYEGDQENFAIRMK